MFRKLTPSLSLSTPYHSTPLSPGPHHLRAVLGPAMPLLLCHAKPKPHHATHHLLNSPCCSSPPQRCRNPNERASDEPQNKKQRLDAAAPQTSTLATEPMEVEEAGQTMETTEPMEVEEAGQTMQTTEDMEVEEAGQTMETTEPMEVEEAGQTMQTTEDMEVEEAGQTMQTTEDMEVEEAGQTLEAMGLVKAMAVMKINESMNAM
ncbi:hypothetical protein FQA47_025539 [Oryzias melastigma]|uniref:Uncharacterized protein n=1 Tax=Oryzias melastigma TaxID=30732 RepID=A0A834C3I4_ORYME|nr:hypothetical protein FQA47_025539 [Oryzias melastigma]